MSSSLARRFDVLLTAQQAFPALEAEFLAARHEIIAGFRVFDPWTRLLSSEGCRIGETWFDLIAHTLDRGVRVSFLLSDFDPVVRQSMHAYAWSCLRGIIAAGEASGHPDRLSARTSMHPARIGILPRLALWPRSSKEIRTGLREVNDRSRAEKEAYLDGVPYLRPLVRWNGDMLQPRLSPPSMVPVTHHQKLAVFDNDTLYIGGLDLNDRRYDTPRHDLPADETWHDTQIVVTGAAARDAAAHLRSFEGITNGAPAPPLKKVLRTVSAKRANALIHLSPKPALSEIADEHAAQIDKSERLIYLESQFFRDKTFARKLASRAAAQADLALILILPAAPEEAAFEDEPGADVAFGEHLQTTAIGIIRKAFGTRLFIGSPAQPKVLANAGRAAHFGAPLIYLHAKVSIFDDRMGIISSANLNGRSMAWDTELGVTTQSTDEVRTLKDQCFRHWLGKDAGPEFFDATTARAAWAARAQRNAVSAPSARDGFILPYLSGPAEEFGYNLPGVPDEMA